jgi:hypothetical protein
MENLQINNEIGPAGPIVLSAYALAVNFSDLSELDASFLMPLMHVTAICAGVASVLIAIRTLFFNKNHK